ncbi:MAG: hypothetical protein J5733_08650 [Bacteroidaceae bacterium]|nr:hypothetical protein [Bacteroidaceae bacterium]
MKISLDNVPLATQSAMLQNILLAFEGQTFSKELAAHIVGGVGKLEKLISAEHVQAEKPSMKQNGKWFVCAPQVLVHCKNRR